MGTRMGRVRYLFRRLLLILRVLISYHSDHPNARHQKRQPEEKGPFGKPTRRKGSSRTARTQTPLRKENLILDGFDAALKHDTERHTELKLPYPGRTTSSGNINLHQSLSLRKEPCQVLLYGYAPDLQWASIYFYENVSGGMICEDYSREPPVERMRFHSGLVQSSFVHGRALTSAEKALAYDYKGGSCWIKITFDSSEAADRALYHSPHLIQGYLVYAQLYHGSGPERDEPILAGGRGQQTARPTSARSQTIGASFSAFSGRRTNMSTRANVTLPRSFSTPGAMDPEQKDSIDESSSSSSTASSATAMTTESPADLRQSTSSVSQLAAYQSTTSSLNSPQVAPQRSTLKLFPDTPRTALRPFNEAFHPQPSRVEVGMRNLTQSGWIPKDIIGSAVPRKESGEFDSATASNYWKFFYWIDTTLGTDWCGLKET